MFSLFQFSRFLGPHQREAKILASKTNTIRTNYSNSKMRFFLISSLFLVASLSDSIAHVKAADEEAGQRKGVRGLQIGTVTASATYTSAIKGTGATEPPLDQGTAPQQPVTDPATASSGKGKGGKGKGKSRSSSDIRTRRRNRRKL